MKKKVARISRAVLKWLIPAQKGRSCKMRAGRNLDLPPYAGYRAREMSARTIRTHSAHAPAPLTKNVDGGCGTYVFPSLVHTAPRGCIMVKSLADWTADSAEVSPSA